MKSKYSKWYHPYKPAKEYNKKVAYFSMEFAIHQALKVYSGGLGFLAGSHMRSAFDLNQNMIGIGMLWKYGYYDQGRKQDQTLQVNYIERLYNFLEDTGIEVSISILDNHDVKVHAYVLKPEIFGSVPLYLLSADVPGNDYLSRTITDHLYDPNELTRISQSMILGIGGCKVVEELGGAEVYHLNEGHALPAFYYLKEKGLSRENMAFTTHTPEKAGNEEHDGKFLNDCGFFGRRLNEDELNKEMVSGGKLSYTVAALRHAKKSNAVSKLHGEVAKEMWKDFEGTSEIIPITNAQHQDFWQDKTIKTANEKKDTKLYDKRKSELKKLLFYEVANQTGKLFDVNKLTIVWARRFAGYKRADLLLRDLDRFEKLVNHSKYPVQIIWAGKPYPRDFEAIDIFNRLIRYTKDKKNLAVLVGYEMALSRLLKTGSDIWLNNPRITREASGTSGMTAAMNGSVNVSTFDGWMPEFAKDEENCFVLPAIDPSLSLEEQDNLDSDNLYKILEKKVLPTFYNDPKKWHEIIFKGIEDVLPEFTSRRMAGQYYAELY